MKRNVSALVVVLVLLLVVSSVGVAGEVLFSFQFPAKRVYLAGEFNNWNATSHPMVEVSPGLWELKLELEEGSYQYKFVADGQWYSDLDAEEFVDDGYGGQNSVLVVGAPAAVASTNTLKLGGYVKAEIAQGLMKDIATDALPNPTLAAETWLKLSGKALDGKLDLFTEVGIKRNSFALNKDIRFQNFVPDEMFLNQTRLTYLGKYADLSYYYKGRSGSSQDFMELWLDQDADGKDKIGWDRSGLGLATRWQDIEGRVIGLKRPNDQLIYGEATWKPEAGPGVGLGLTYTSKPNGVFESGYEKQLNATLWSWYQLTDQIKLEGQFLVSHGGRVEYEDMAKVPYIFVMTEDGAGDGQIGQGGTYDDIAYAQLRGAHNSWAWETTGGGWDKYQEEYAYNLTKQADGTWTLPLELAPGEYEFKVRLFNAAKEVLGDVWGPHPGGNAKFTVAGATKPIEAEATGYAYLLRGIYEEETYGSKVTLKAAHADVKNEVGGVGQNYFDVTTDSWYQVLPEAKLTFFTKNSYSYDLQTTNEILLKPGVKYVPAFEYITSIGAWYEHYLKPTSKANKFGLNLEAAYLGFGLESKFTVDTAKQWELKNTLKGMLPEVEVEVETELGFKNEFWWVKAEARKDVLADVNLKVKSDYNKDKVFGAGSEVAWFFPNTISDDLRLYLDYSFKSEPKTGVQTTTAHRIAVGVKGDF